MSFSVDISMFIEKLKQKVKILKAEVLVLKIAYTDKRTPLLAKLLIGLTVAYLLSPIDLIPDFIPILGLIDDLILVPVLITAAIKLVPEEVLTSARQYIIDNPAKIKKNNWFFAVLIVFVWVLLFYLGYKHILKQQ